MKHKITAVTFLTIIFVLSLSNSIDGEAFREPFRRIKAVFDINILRTAHTWFFGIINAVTLKIGGVELNAGAGNGRKAD